LRRGGCRQDGLVRLPVAELPERVRRVVERAVHRRRREECRGNEGGVLERLPAHADRDVANPLERVDEEEEVEERLEEPGEEDHPGPAVHHHVPLDNEEAADRRASRGRQSCACDELSHTTSLPPYQRSPTPNPPPPTPTNYPT